MAEAIEVNGLKKYYGEVKAVDGVSFSVSEGSIFGMLGPNGAGKTTTVETIVGLLDSTEGEINVLGMSAKEQREKIKRNIGVQLQDPSLFPRLTVKETLDLFASFFPDPLLVDDAADQVGMTENLDKRVQSLSGGQSHRLAVALALVSNGKVIFLDEPTTGLDPKARRDLWKTVRGLKSRNSTTFLTTHYMDEAEQLCDKLVIIDRGKIIARGSPGDLIERNFPHQAVEFTDPGLNSSERARLETLVNSRTVNFEEKKGKIILYSEDVAITVNDLIRFTETHDKPLEGLTVRSATLDDVFLKLTGRGIENE